MFLLRFFLGLGYAKVSDSRLELIHHEDVLRLEIKMDYFLIGDSGQLQGQLHNPVELVRDCLILAYIFLGFEFGKLLEEVRCQ